MFGVYHLSCTFVSILWLLGSLAKLSFSFCMWNVLAFLQMVDTINGKVMSSMVIVLALKVRCNT